MIHRDRRWIMRFDLSDEEWTLLELLVPNSRKSACASDRRIRIGDVSPCAMTNSTGTSSSPRPSSVLSSGSNYEPRPKTPRFSTQHLCQACNHRRVAGTATSHALCIMPHRVTFENMGHDNAVNPGELQCIRHLPKQRNTPRNSIFLCSFHGSAYILLLEYHGAGKAYQHCLTR